MSSRIKRIIIVGGGSAGWLTAGTLAAEFKDGLQISLIESPDIPIIGVGEGTWPSMRETLRRIGLSENTFIRECDASFKQGSKFINWRALGDHFYYHPFSLPEGYFETNSIPYWQTISDKQSFADALCSQESLCEKHLAPKQLATPEYAAVTNYGYHLDAGKFGQLLKQHCVEILGVEHISDNVCGIKNTSDGYIASLATEHHGQQHGDLFIDCTGSKGLLLEKHFGVKRINQKHILFNDRALAVQTTYEQEDQDIVSATLSTAQTCGWIWDIGLPTRRGVGHVFSSSHTSPEAAEVELKRYLSNSIGPKKADALSPRLLKFEPGHLEEFWHKNAVAIGMSAGFIEPLEASALALVEMSASLLRDDMPVSKDLMPLAAKRFNEKFSYRWSRILEFLKLHYILSERRDSQYWIDHQNQTGIPDRLLELLQLWQHQAPSRRDFEQSDEIFPAASYQYVLYGMGFKTDFGDWNRQSTNAQLAKNQLRKNSAWIKKAMQSLPSNRQLLNQLKQRA